MYREGDLVECLGSYPNQFTEGGIYEVKEYRAATHQNFWFDDGWGEILVVKDDNNSNRNGWNEKFFKLHKRKVVMTDTVNKYDRLLEYSDGADSKYKNMVFVVDSAKVVVSTNGSRLLAQRTNYEEIKVLSRVIDSNGSMEFKDGVFVASSKDKPDLNPILPTTEKLAVKDYKKIRLMVPDWIKGIDKKEDAPRIGFVLGEVPSLAIGDFGEHVVGINAHYLKPFCGAIVDVYVKDDVHSPIVVMPSGGNVETVEWFALVMPMRKDRTEGPQYFKPGEEVSQK